MYLIYKLYMIYININYTIYKLFKYKYIYIFDSACKQNKH